MPTLQPAHCRQHLSACCQQFLMHSLCFCYVAGRSTSFVQTKLQRDFPTLQLNSWKVHSCCQATYACCILLSLYARLWCFCEAKHHPALFTHNVFLHLQWLEMGAWHSPNAQPVLQQLNSKTLTLAWKYNIDVSGLCSCSCGLWCPW